MMKYLKKLTQKQIRLIVFALTIIISLLIIADLVEDIFYDPTVGDIEMLVYDKAILKAMHRFRSPELNQSVLDITALGSFSVIALLTCIIAVFVIVHKDWKGLSYIFFIAVGTTIIPVALKDIFNRTRPEAIDQLTYVKSSSFPSGHSFGATVAYFSLAYLLSRELKELKLEF
ncbi:MAG: phosphatase PAP2 family protein, partial [Bdellovibrionales bacterium]|nr:phosphatase PAP2 family protein [Bdellovibrionales bacterium]